MRWNRRTPTFHESRSIVCARGRGAQPCYPAEIQHQRCSRLNSVNTAGHQGPKSTASRRPRSSPAEETAEYHFVEGERQFQDLLKTGRWRDAPAVFDGLRQEGCHLNLRTYRACMAVMAEHGKGEEAMRYLQQMEVGGLHALLMFSLIEFFARRNLMATIRCSLIRHLPPYQVHDTSSSGTQGNAIISYVCFHV